MVKTNNVTNDKPLVKQAIVLAMTIAKQMSVSINETRRKWTTIGNPIQPTPKSTNELRNITKHDSFFFRGDLFQMVMAAVAFNNTEGNMRRQRNTMLDIRIVIYLVDLKLLT